MLTSRYLLEKDISISEAIYIVFEFGTDFSVWIARNSVFIVAI